MRAVEVDGLDQLLLHELSQTRVVGRRWLPGSDLGEHGLVAALAGHTLGLAGYLLGLPRLSGGGGLSLQNGPALITNSVISPCYTPGAGNVW